MAEGVFVVGALHLDVVVDAPHLPAPDETVQGDRVAYRFGGKGGNQAVAAVRFGAPVAMAGRVGNDPFGERILQALDAAGVDRLQVRIVDGASGMSVAVVEQAGSYGAVIVSGVNRNIRPEQIEIPATAGALLLQNEIPEAVNLAVARKAREGTRVILNAAPARDISDELLKHVDVLVVNRVEAEGLTGESDPVAALRALRGRGVPSVIVTLGEAGLIGAGPGGGFRMPAHNVPVVSTHGAGDAFIGALAAELVHGAALEPACDTARAAAALLVSTDPDRRNALTRRDVRDFVQAHR